MKLNKVAKVVALLAVTIPLTVLSARADFNDDFQSYSQNLQARISSGRASGRLNNNEYNRLMNLWNQVNAVNGQFRGRNPNPQERNSLMASLTTLDRELTNNLHDDQFSRYQYWDPSRSSWKSDWQNRTKQWLPNSSTSRFDDEIEAYERNLRSRIDQGRASGQLNSREYDRLSDQLRQINQAQRDHRNDNNYNFWERNTLMSMLTNLDRDIVAELRDNNMSRYQYWNQDNFSWNQSWWQPGWQGGGAVVPVADQGSYDDQINAYEWNLRDRLQRGFSSGRITQNELNRIQSQLDDFDRQQWQSRNSGFLDVNTRNRLMNTLVNIDKNLSRQLNDNESRYQYWNASNNSWSNNWWSNLLTGNVANNNYDEEIEAYRNNIRGRLNSGRSGGRLTPSEYNRLNASYQSFENLYNRYRAKGINTWERSALMNMLSNLDRDVVAQLRDNDQSRYQYWNPNRQNWSQQWWRSSNNRNDNRDDRNDRIGNNWNNNNNNNNNNNWRGRNDAKQAAEKAARDAAAREAAERAARDAAAKAAAEKAAREAAARAARDNAAREAAERARDAARNERRNDNNDGWKNRGDRGNNNNWNRGRGNDNNNNNNNNNNDRGRGNDNDNNNSVNNRRGDDNQASGSNNDNNNDRGRGRGRGRNRDGNDNN